VSDDGTVVIGAHDQETGDKVKSQIERLTKDLAVGDKFSGKVSRIMAFGAFVEILPGKDGLVHISELADHRVESVESQVSIGDELDVEVIEIDRMGRVNLTARLSDDHNRSTKLGRDDDMPSDEHRRPPFKRERDDHHGSRSQGGGQRGRSPNNGNRRKVGGHSGDDERPGRRPPFRSGGNEPHRRR